MRTQNAASHSGGAPNHGHQKSHHGGHQQQQRTWIKNHQLEGDGIITGFYNFLYKRNGKMKPCEGVLIPDTIVYDHNFPRGWYTSDLKNKEITKRQGKELDADSITRGFSKPPNPSLNVVASYMCSYEEDDKVTGETQMVTSVEFFNEDTLKEFVGRKTKREGILQRFLAPKGLRNSVIQAVWSPRVCIVQRRTNCGSIKDKLQCERDPYPVAVTYEGPTHFSEQGECAPHTSEKVERVCNNILHHFLAIERKYITRIVLYFKVDERDQLWLLFCGSLRVSDRDAPSMMPLNLAPKFSSPSLENGGVSGTSEKEEEALFDADTRHYEMTNDRLFYAQFVRNSPRTLMHSNHGAGHGGSHAGAHEGPNQGAAGGRRDEMIRKEQAAKARAEAKKKAREEASEMVAQWHQAPGIQEQYNELMLEREMVLSHFDDVFYEAYGHFLRHEPGNFEFEVDRRVATVLGVDLLQELMQACKIDHALPSEDTSRDDEELCFAIPQSAHRTPTKQQGDCVAAWVRAHYDRRLQELKEEAISNSDHRAVIQHHSNNHQQQQNNQSAVKPKSAVPIRSAVDTWNDIKHNYLLGGGGSSELLMLNNAFAPEIPAADAAAGLWARQQMFSSVSGGDNTNQAGVAVEDFVKGLRERYGFNKLDQHFHSTVMNGTESEGDFLLHIVASVISIAKARTTSFLHKQEDDVRYSNMIRDVDDLLHVLHGTIVSLDVWAAVYDLTSSSTKGKMLCITNSEDFFMKLVTPLQQHVERFIHGGRLIAHLQDQRDATNQYNKLCAHHNTKSLLFDPHLSTWVVNTCFAHYMSAQEKSDTDKDVIYEAASDKDTKKEDEWMED